MSSRWVTEETSHISRVSRAGFHASRVEVAIQVAAGWTEADEGQAAVGRIEATVMQPDDIGGLNDRRAPCTISQVKGCSGSELAEIDVEMNAMSGKGLHNG